MLFCNCCEHHIDNLKEENCIKTTHMNHSYSVYEFVYIYLELMLQQKLTKYKYSEHWNTNNSEKSDIL